MARRWLVPDKWFSWVTIHWPLAHCCFIVCPMKLLVCMIIKIPQKFKWEWGSGIRLSCDLRSCALISNHVTFVNNWTIDPETWAAFLCHSSNFRKSAVFILWATTFKEQCGYKGWMLWRPHPPSKQDVGLKMCICRLWPKRAEDGAGEERKEYERVYFLSNLPSYFSYELLLMPGVCVI